LPSIQQPFTKEKESSAASTSLFKGFTQKNQAHFIEKNELKHWKDLYQSQESGVRSSESGALSAGRQVQSQEKENTSEFKSLLTTLDSRLTTHNTSITQIHNQYILTSTPAGFILIDQQAAHERVIYERLMNASKDKPVSTQRSIFPVTIELTPADAVLIDELKNELNLLGFLVEPFGKNTFVVQGTPADVPQGNEKQAIDFLLEQFKHFSSDIKFSKREKLIRSLAWQQSIKAGASLTEKEMKGLADDLFQCATPNSTPGGNPTYLEFKKDLLEKMFGR
jgi:DNA mismatch repair protein MutL